MSAVIRLLHHRSYLGLKTPLAHALVSTSNSKCLSTDPPGSSVESNKEKDKKKESLDDFTKSIVEWVRGLIEIFPQLNTFLQETEGRWLHPASSHLVQKGDWGCNSEPQVGINTFHQSPRSLNMLISGSPRAWLTGQPTREWQHWDSCSTSCQATNFKRKWTRWTRGQCSPGAFSQS